MKNLKKDILSLMLAACTTGVSAQQTAIHLQNRLPVERKNELIVIDRTVMEKKAGKKIEKDGIILEAVNRKVIPLQFDDLNQDGKWDKAVFLLSFEPNESVDVNIVLTPSGEVPRYVDVAHVRQRRKMPDNSFGPSLGADSVAEGQPNTDFSKSTLPPYLTEGPAWENDKVGFRIYMDVRNTKDIWGKTTPHMMMDTVGVDPKVVYHHLAAWGMDILAVGKSLGAGSLALSVPRKGQADTLVRLGGVNMGKIRYRQIADGPVRAVLEMEYPAWNVLGDGHLSSLTEQITIWGGQYFYESNVSLKNAPAGSKVVTGIVNLKSTQAVKERIASATFQYTFAQQSENKDNLGLAVMLRQADLVSFGQTPNQSSDVLNTYTALMKAPAPGKTTAYRFYACWEHSDPAFAAESTFKGFLENDALRYSSPIVVR